MPATPDRIWRAIRDAAQTTQPGHGLGAAKATQGPLKRAGWSLLVLALLAGLIEIAIHHYDPTRVIYKRPESARSPFYEEIDPKLRKQMSHHHPARHDPGSRADTAKN